jgi:hypothetical protein
VKDSPPSRAAEHTPSIRCRINRARGKIVEAHPAGPTFSVTNASAPVSRRSVMVTVASTTGCAVSASKHTSSLPDIAFYIGGDAFAEPPISLDATIVSAGIGPR